MDTRNFVLLAVIALQVMVEGQRLRGGVVEGFIPQRFRRCHVRGCPGGIDSRYKCVWRQSEEYLPDGVGEYCPMDSSGGCVCLPGCYLGRSYFLEERESIRIDRCTRCTCLRFSDTAECSRTPNCRREDRRERRRRRRRQRRRRFGVDRRRFGVDRRGFDGFTSNRFGSDGFLDSLFGGIGMTVGTGIGPIGTTRTRIRTMGSPLII